MPMQVLGTFTILQYACHECVGIRANTTTFLLVGSLLFVTIAVVSLVILLTNLGLVSCMTCSVEAPLWFLFG